MSSLHWDGARTVLKVSGKGLCVRVGGRGKRGRRLGGGAQVETGSRLLLLVYASTHRSVDGWMDDDDDGAEAVESKSRGLPWLILQGSLAPQVSKSKVLGVAGARKRPREIEGCGGVA